MKFDLVAADDDGYASALHGIVLDDAEHVSESDLPRRTVGPAYLGSTVYRAVDRVVFVDNVFCVILIADRFTDGLGNKLRARKCLRLLGHLGHTAAFSCDTTARPSNCRLP